LVRTAVLHILVRATRTKVAAGSKRALLGIHKAAAAEKQQKEKLHDDVYH
jgi:hypothetical protein